jgi:predicted dehydrogenase
MRIVTMSERAGRVWLAAASRREFLKTSTAMGAGAGLAGELSIGRSAHAAGSDILKVGLIGCGGRGTGAAANALNADPNAKLVAMGDAFSHRLEGSLKSLQALYGARVEVPRERRFVGFDAYQKVIASGVDVVILAEPPHFRPCHLKAAIEAGKHVFCEKPVAVDAPGVRSVLATCQEAKKKNLSIVSGLIFRYHPGMRESMQRVFDGAVGDVLNIQETCLVGTLWQFPRQPQWTEMEFQMRNWYYFTWLSGDHIVEQHVHSLDRALWAMHDEPPVRAWGLGGRQVRTDPKFGDIYDHHAVVFEYPNGATVHSYTRQQAGCHTDYSEVITGAKGRAKFAIYERYEINDLAGKSIWRYKAPPANPWDIEHQALFSAIRSGKPINNGLYMARSTMMAILGRMAEYTGKLLTWDEAMNSRQVLAPKSYAWDAEPPTKPGADGRYPVAMPGITRFV